jgi:hypothetical protein
MKLTVLQDRIAQAGVLAETSRTALARVHEAMFPLNNQPDGLPALLDRFENSEAVYRLFASIFAAGLWSPFPSCAPIILRSTWNC